MPPDLFFPCPSCATPLVAESALSGRTVYCPECDTPARVPMSENEALMEFEADLSGLALRISRLNGSFMAMSRRQSQRNKELETLVSSFRHAARQLGLLADAKGPEPQLFLSQIGLPVRIPAWGFALGGFSATAALIVLCFAP